MLYMFSLLPWVSSLALITFAPSVSSVPDDVTLASVVTSADTGTAETNPIPLTPAVVASYAAVEKALAAYWGAHPDQAKVANAHGHAVNIAYTDNKSHTHLTTGFTVPDYPSVVHQDTTVAAIFTQHALSPVQFQPTEQSVRNAITAVIQQQTPDSSVMGRNMAVVQAHRPELATDWSEVQTAIQLSQGFMQTLIQTKTHSQGQGSDLDP